MFKNILFRIQTSAFLCVYFAGFVAEGLAKDEVSCVKFLAASVYFACSLLTYLTDWERHLKFCWYLTIIQTKMKDILKYLMEWKQQTLFTYLFTVDLNQTEFIAFKKNTYRGLLPQLGSRMHTMRQDKKSATKYRFFFLLQQPTEA